jgi:uncharacterized protein YggE
MLKVWWVIAALWAGSALAADVDFPHVVVTGYGEVNANPDHAEISVKVVESNVDAQKAKQVVDKVVADFTQRIVNQGISTDHIDSANISLRPEYHRTESGKTETIGYRATRTVKVTVKDLSKLDALLSDALGGGINSIDYVKLMVSEEQSYRELARMAAIRDANQKAASLAAGFERELGNVWQVNYQHRGPIRASVREHVALDSSRDTKDYTDATISISDDVQVIYQLN